MALKSVMLSTLVLLMFSASLPRSITGARLLEDFVVYSEDQPLAWQLVNDDPSAFTSMEASSIQDANSRVRRNYQGIEHESVIYSEDDAAGAEVPTEVSGVSSKEAAVEGTADLDNSSAQPKIAKDLLGEDMDWDVAMVFQGAEDSGLEQLFSDTENPAATNAKQPKGGETDKMAVEEMRKMAHAMTAEVDKVELPSGDNHKAPKFSFSNSRKMLPAMKKQLLDLWKGRVEWRG